MGQPLRIDSNVPFDARYLLTGVITFVLGRIGILHALCIHDDKCRLLVATPAEAGLTHCIFLMRAPAG